MCYRYCCFPIPTAAATFFRSLVVDPNLNLRQRLLVASSISLASHNRFVKALEVHPPMFSSILPFYLLVVVSRGVSVFAMSECA